MKLPESHQYVNFHAHRHTSSSDEWVLTSVMLEDYPGEIRDGSYSIGLHPWSIKLPDTHDTLGALSEAVSHPDVIAIGEAGLDKAIDVPMELQLEVFEKQLQLATEINYPVIVHCVRADSELIALSKRYRDLKMIYHGFLGNKEQAMILVKHGFYLSVGKTMLRSEKLRKALVSIPDEKILFETDEADIAIRDIYRFAAQLKELDIARLREQVYLNAQEIFSVS